MNFIFINSDTFRRDHLGCYGNEWIETPNLDRFAEDSIVFDRAYTGSFPTVPNRRDVLTGRYTFTYSDWAPLTSQETVLAQVLRSADYMTFMVLDTLHIVANGFGFDRAFNGWKWIRGQEGDRYKTHPAEVEFPCDVAKLRGGTRTMTQYLRNIADRRSEEDHFAPMTMSEATRWLERNHTWEKFFLYVDTFDPHEPWDPPKKYIDMYNPGYEGEEVTYPLYAPCGFMTDPEMEHVKALYAGEVSMVDVWIGKLLRKIEELGLFENTAVIFTSDHGFGFGEHGLIGKFSRIYEEVSRIPLIMRVPGMRAGRRTQFVQPCDLMPTILDLAGIEHPPTIQGKSLVEVLQGSKEPVREFAVTSFAIVNPPVADKPVVLTAENWGQFARSLRPSTVTSDEWTLIFSGGDLETELYHNTSDPHQQNNVFEDNKGIARDLHARYLDLLESLGTKKDYIAPRRRLVGL